MVYSPADELEIRLAPPRLPVSVLVVGDVAGGGVSGPENPIALLIDAGNASAEHGWEI